MSDKEEHASSPANDRMRPGSNDPLQFIAAGQANLKERRLKDAAFDFQVAIDLDPNLPMAHNNLGWVRQQLGDISGALLCYRKALELNGSFRLAQINLALLLSEMGLSAEAQQIWSGLAFSYPNDRALLDKIITESLKAGDVSSASVFAERYAFLTRGSRWFCSEADGIQVPEVPFPEPQLSVPKLKHDLEQFSYLRGLGILVDDLANAERAYRRVLERAVSLGDDGRMKLSNADRELIGHIYDRIVYRRPAPRVQRALSTVFSPESAEEEYLCSPLGVVVLDNFLSEEAVVSLRSFCLESTIWFANRPHGRLGAFFREGFNCPLLAQIASELSVAFPRLIGQRHPLLQMWGFKYAHYQPPTGAHADFAAVNVNIWLTPDEANLGGGGLVIYNAEAPADWDFATYNSRGDKIAQFLRARRARSITIPYKANRAIVFNSDLFHATEPVNFRQGYENRRLNVTMLFGRRETQRLESTSAVPLGADSET